MSKRIRISEFKSQYNDKTQIKVNMDDYDKLANKDALEDAVGDDGEVTLTTEGEETNSNLERDIFFAGLKEGNSCNEGTFIGDLSKNKTALSLWDNYKKDSISENSENIDSLYSDSDNNKIEYGISNDDEFEGLMERLKINGSKKIKISENIKPRIKKNDLITYFKTKYNDR